MNLVETVKAYYSRVDAGDVERVISLFSENGTYQRADASYEGKESIAEFYRCDRKISGRHSLENVVADAGTVIANGIFKGVGADGSPKKIGFADVWSFDDDGLVVCRKTYLAAGSDYVKD